MPDATSMFVICNPVAGRGKATQRIEALRRKFANDDAVFAMTEAPGHAETLAREAIERGYSIIGAAGGDGMVHEVINGIFPRPQRKISLFVEPCGSANDFCYAFNRRDAFTQRSTMEHADGVNVGRVKTASGRERYFINGAGIGFNCAVTRQARRITWLRGVPLYTLALVRALAADYAAPEMQLAEDGQSLKERPREPTLSLTVMNGRREGNFLLAPQAALDDGLFDVLHVGRMSRLRLFSYVPRMIFGFIPQRRRALRTFQCAKLELRSSLPLFVHLDGELFIFPEEEENALSIEYDPLPLPVLRPAWLGPAGMRER